MNSRERFLAAMRGETPDRAPLAHVAALTNVDVQRSTGCPMPEAHLDAEKMVCLCAANHTVFGFDAVTFIINFFNEPAALGCGMDWGSPEQLPAYTSHPWSEPEQAVMPEDLLDRPPVSIYLEALRLAKARYGDEVGVIGKVMGPLSMTQVMHGLEQTMMDMIERPKAIRAFLRVCVEVGVRCANAQFEQGIDALSIGEGGAGANMVSPRMHEELLLEFHREMVRRIDGPTVMHICGDITPRLEILKKMGLHCFNFDWAVEPKVMKSMAAGSFRLMGNVNTGDLMRGTPEEIERQVAENLEAGVEIISPGCAVSPLCPTENLRAMAAGIRKWSG